MKKTKKKLEILKRLRILIDEAHISQAKIARQMGTSPALISRWKSGDITPSLESYERICKILNEDVDYLLTGVAKFNKTENNPKNNIENNKIISDQQKEICDLYRKIYEKDAQIILMLKKINPAYKTKKAI